MDLLNLFIAFIIPALIGAIIIRLLFDGKTDPWLMFLPAFPLGLGILTLWMLVLLILKVPLSKEIVAVPLLILSLLAVIILRRKEVAATNARHGKNKLSLGSPPAILVWPVVLFIVIQLDFIFCLSAIIPISTWDGIYTIAAKAKYFLFGGGLQGLSQFPATASYPLHVELSLTWLALNLGHWDNQILRIIFPAMLVHYLVFQFCFVRNILGWWKALLSIALLLSSYFLVYQGGVEYRAIFFMYYNLVPLLLLCEYRRSKNINLIVLAGLLTGIGTFTKLESAGHLAIFAALIMFFNAFGTLKERISILLRFLLPSFVILIVFGGVKYFYHLGGFEGRLGLSINDTGARINAIACHLGDNLFKSGNWNSTWGLLLASAVLFRKRITRLFETRFFIAALLFYFALYIFVGLFTNTFYSLFYDWVTLPNLSRTILHFFPLCPLIIILLSHQDRQRQD
jgi:hypothetical protein